MIELRNVTKIHGEKVAVSDLSFTVRPGTVTGTIEIEGLTAQQIGDAAAANAIVLHELAPQQACLARGGVHGYDQRRRRVPDAGHSQPHHGD